MLFDHLCVGTFSISRMWISSETYLVMSGHSRVFDPFPFWETRFELYLDNTRNIQYMHLQIDYCRTLEISSPERLESYVNGKFTCTRTL